jgi:hypothetical protein
MPEEVIASPSSGILAAKYQRADMLPRDALASISTECESPNGWFAYLILVTQETVIK